MRTYHSLLLRACAFVLVFTPVWACSDSEETARDASVPDATFAADASGSPDAAPPDAAPADAGADAGLLDAGDPCDIAHGGCAVHATCTSTTGQAVCRCEPGYVGDGVVCDDVVATLSGLRWQLPCTSGDNGNHVCSAAGATSTSTTVSGAPNQTYSVTLRFRGVVEQKTYVGGKNDGAYFQIGGSPAGDGFNVYSLQVSEPPGTYYLNRGASSIYYSFPIDYTAVIPMTAGATITLVGDPLDGAEIQNVDVNGTPIVVPEIAPAPAAYDGQFIQMDVLSVVPNT